MKKKTDHALHGLVDQSALGRKNDYLYRVSIKCFIQDTSGNVLVVKEAGRTWWDLPGGGMDHGENIRAAIARELFEEVGLQGNFTYRVIHVDDPAYLPNANVLQVRLVFDVTPNTLPSDHGIDADEIAYLDPVTLKDSANPIERKIYAYATMLDTRTRKKSVPS